MLFLWGCGMIFLVPGINDGIAPPAGSGGVTGGSFISQVLGEGKGIVSGMSLLQADRYYHGGVYQVCDHFTGEGEDHPGEGESEDLFPGHDLKAKPYNLLFRLAGETKITKHVHLEGDQLKEMIPWLYYSVKADPHNVGAVTLAAYYLSQRFGRVDEAVALLEQGRRDNPDSWEIYAELGNIYFSKMGDVDKAILFLSRAKQLLGKTQHDRFQARYVLTLLGASYEKAGDLPAAVEQYEVIHELFPDNTAISEKLSHLKNEF